MKTLLLVALTLGACYVTANAAAIALISRGSFGDSQRVDAAGFTNTDNDTAATTRRSDTGEAADQPNPEGCFFWLAQCPDFADSVQPSDTAPQAPSITADKDCDITFYLLQRETATAEQSGSLALGMADCCADEFCDNVHSSAADDIVSEHIHLNTETVLSFPWR